MILGYKTGAQPDLSVAPAPALPMVLRRSARRDADGSALGVSRGAPRAVPAWASARASRTSTASLGTLERARTRSTDEGTAPPGQQLWGGCFG